jgi:hypothetical protein
MDHMSLGEGDGEEIVDMGGEALEAGFIAHEAMDVDEQQRPAAISGGL